MCTPQGAGVSKGIQKRQTENICCLLAFLEISTAHTLRLNNTTHCRQQQMQLQQQQKLQQQKLQQQQQKPSTHMHKGPLVHCASERCFCCSCPQASFPHTLMQLACRSSSRSSSNSSTCCCSICCCTTTALAVAAYAAAPQQQHLLQRLLLYHTTSSCCCCAAAAVAAAATAAAPLLCATSGYAIAALY